MCSSRTAALDAIPNVGQITLACALGYGDLRFGGKWRESHPKLVKWLDAFAAKVPAFEKTRVTACRPLQRKAPATAFSFDIRLAQNR
jgi:hypothetical protein